MRTRRLLLIFTRNPELGKVKSRLAKDIGQERALEVYKALLSHTNQITRDVEVDKWLYYAGGIPKHDIWDPEIFTKKKQFGDDLGAKMEHAFQEGFAAGYEQIVIIGSDMLDIQQAHIETAFKKLNGSDVVIGPAEDGGYYLLGVKQEIPKLFKNKSWGQSTVFKDTLRDLNDDYSCSFLEILNDIDVISDIKSDSRIYKLLQL